MPKQLINLIGGVICAGVLILGIVLGVAPLVAQALATSAEAAQVGSSNALYTQQVETLQQQEQRLDEINGSVNSLRAGIPATPQLDDVFELIAEAAQSSGVSVETITAGDVVPFVERTSAVGIEGIAANVAAATAATPEEESDGEAGDGAEQATTADGEPTPDAATPAGRTQVDFTIRVDASDMSQAVAFLDALRSNPRLFSTVDTLISTTGVAIDVDVTGLAYLLGES